MNKYNLNFVYEKQIEILNQILGLEQFLLSNKVEVHIAKKPKVTLKNGLLLVYITKQNDLNTLLRIVKENNDKKEFTIELDKKIDNLTYMMDASRNAVAKVETVKELALKLALFGYDEIQLYTEDTLEIKDEPYFGYLRGAYSKEEIKEIEDFCAKLGIELVPCIQTLAHFNQITRYHEYSPLFDVNDILLSDNEDTYVFIEKIIKTVKENFKSNKINIGMDEAYMIGRGRYLDKFGYKPKFDVMISHLNRVLEICKKYDLKPMMWSDMFFALTFSNYYENNEKMPIEILNKIPKEVSLIYWDYYKTDTNIYDMMLEKHKAFSNPIMFAGGVWKWIGFTPDNRYSITATKAAMQAVIKNDIKQVIVTAWGDNGGEASQFSILPGLAYYGQTKFNKLEMDNELKNSFEIVTGVNFDTFMLIDSANQLNGNVEDKSSAGKHFFYNDILLGLMDTNVDTGYKEIFENKFNIYKENITKFGKYTYLFDTQYKLIDVLRSKVEIGVELRKAYKEKNIDKLNEINIILKEIITKVDVFYESLKKQWHIENKAFGFDVQDLRIGGLKQRLLQANSKITDYLNGNITKIEELEVVLQDYYGKRQNYQKLKDQIEYSYLPIVTVNVNR